LRVIYEPNSFIKQDSGINLRRSQHHVPYPSLEFGIILGGTGVSVCCPSEEQEEKEFYTTHSPTHSNQIMKQALKLLRRRLIQILTATNQIVLLLAFRRTRREFYILPTVPPTQIK
jgi:hypothetical protein